MKDNPDSEEAAKGDGGILAGELAVAAEILPGSLHILPLYDRPFFPIQTMPLVLDSEHWLETVKAVGETAQHAVGLISVHPQEKSPPEHQDFAAVGTAVRVHNPTRSRDDTIQFIAEGVQRFRVIRWLSKNAPFRAQVEYLDDVVDENSSEVKAYAMAILNVIKELIPLNPLYNEELKLFLDKFKPTQPAFLAFFGVNLTNVSAKDFQQVLATNDVLERMKLVLPMLHKELEVARLQAQIRAQVEQKMGEQQRQFFLKEQLKVIQQELGLSKDDRTADIERFEQRMEALELPDHAQERIDEEMQKLSILESGSPEYGVTRNYLDWLTGIPWGKNSQDNLDLDRAREILERDHWGLDDVKRRIVEFLALGKLRGGVKGSILLFVGPPGVGKTSIGQSIAEALGREFYRFSVGGMRDEAEIKGHRRTYVGAMPGKFIQAIKEAGVSNPVIMLDEIDKVGASYRGDPASALLEVLDPEQNNNFLDHYVDVRVDISNALFVCTANQLDTIPRALLDRMETIRLSGYIAEEKFQIGKRHLWPKQLRKAGLKSRQLKLADAAIRRIIEGYAREAGVRGLDKQFAKLVRSAAVRIVEGHSAPIAVRAGDVESQLGPPRFRQEKPISGVGVVTGLAWTAMGGATLDVEANRIHTKNRGFRYTGKLGDVMKESAQIAYSYVASHLAEYGCDLEFFDKAYVHIHVPEGATPKDGPSAGVTMASSLVSLARRQKIRRPLAMTGELTLTGQVYPVGGIREKVIAARRNKIKELILPEGNRGDYEELPDYLKKGMKVSFAAHYADVFRTLFG